MATEFSQSAALAVILTHDWAIDNNVNTVDQLTEKLSEGFINSGIVELHFAANASKAQDFERVIQLMTMAGWRFKR